MRYQNMQRQGGRTRVPSDDSSVVAARDAARMRVVEFVVIGAITVGILIGSLAASLKLGNEFNKSYGGAELDYQDGINSGLAGELYLGFIPAGLLTYVFLRPEEQINFDVKILATAAMTVLTALAGSTIRISLSKNYKSHEGYHPKMSTTTLGIGVGEGATLLAIGLIALRNAYEYHKHLEARRRLQYILLPTTGSGSTSQQVVTETGDASLGGDAVTNKRYPFIPNSGTALPTGSTGKRVRAATDASNDLKAPLLPSQDRRSPTNLINV